jgi:molybdopterin-guanine dinucleotide biosynthesis protein A
MKTISSDLWVLLAGGQGRRMGGQDKGLIEWQNTALGLITVNNLRQQGQTVVINANRNITKYQTWGEVFSDENNDFMGPLSGMLAAFHHYPNAEWIGFVPCDCPFLPRDLVKRMTTNIPEKTQIIVAHDGQRIHPTIALLHRSVVPSLRDFLNNGDRKIQLFYQQCQTKVQAFHDCPTAFNNLNTPEDLAVATKNHTS